MYDTTDTFLFKFRYPLAIIFVVLCLATLPFLLSIIWIKPTVSAASSHTVPDVNSVVTSDSPNMVTNGLFSAVNGFSSGLDKTQKAIGYGISSASSTVASATATTGKAIARGTIYGVGVVANAVSTGASFTVGTAGNIVGFVADGADVNLVIKPAESATRPVPVIVSQGVVQNSISPEKSKKINTLATSPPKEKAPIWPIHGAITTQFGVPHWPFQPTHTGIDISDGKAPGITPVRPFESGVVKEVIHSSVGFGNHVIVDHGDGLISLYGHMYKTAVKVGQKVNQSSILGYEGSTGASTGSHVHFELQLNGTPVDPHKYVSGHP